MPSTSESSGSDTSTSRAVSRYLAGRFGSSPALGVGVPPLEATSRAPERAHVIAARTIEGTIMGPRRIPDETGPQFAAFLDGVQRSHALAYVENGIPIVAATVAAVIRERRQRRLFTWRRLVLRVLCIPRRLTPDAWDDAAPLMMVDTTADDTATETRLHPTDLVERAVAAVQTKRRALEQELAEAWIESEETPLFIDGGIGDRERIARSPVAIGVIKSHRTLFAEPDVLASTLGLGREERSTAFRIASDRRATVVSWYLRLRDPRPSDPFFGLVRVEIADGLADGDLTTRVDEVSSWILAERVPLSLPDGRWDKLIYGVWDCEQYLKAVV